MEIGKYVDGRSLNTDDALSGHEPSIAAIQKNPTLHPSAFAIVHERFRDLKWHSRAGSPDSSQAFALSAFVPLLGFADKDAILDRFVTQVFPHIPPRTDRSWQVMPEFVQRELLGETGQGVPTNVDALLVADDVVVCVESKFRVDAIEGFGRCSQYVSGACRGFHGRGSDAKGTSASCRLSERDGRRDARRYWELGRGHFQVEALMEQNESQVCPYRDTYQLMRNYLFAAELAKRDDKAYFGVIGIVPRARNTAVAAGVQRFQEQVMLPENARRVAAVDYEDYIALLAGSPEARGLGTFLRELLQ